MQQPACNSTAGLRCPQTSVCRSCREAGRCERMRSMGDGCIVTGMPGQLQLGVYSKETGSEVVVLPFEVSSTSWAADADDSDQDLTPHGCSHCDCPYMHISSQPWKVQPPESLRLVLQVQAPAPPVPFAPPAPYAKPAPLPPLLREHLEAGLSLEPRTCFRDSPRTWSMSGSSLDSSVGSADSAAITEDPEDEKAELLLEATAVQDTPRMRPMRNKFHKTRICRFFLEGKCRKKGACNYAHGEQEMSTQPDLRRTKMCPAVVSGGACTSPCCTFAHSASELRAEPKADSPKAAKQRAVVV